jgi:general secretion pathway protein H
MAVTRPQASGHSGFTLIELLVVVAILAIALGLVSLAIPVSATRQLEREADRLSALLESARHQSQSTGVAMLWRPDAEGFRFEGPDMASWPRTWLEQPAPEVSGSLPLLLGPEPMLPPQAIRLTSATREGSTQHSLEIHSDGISPFRVRQVQP